MLARPLGPPRFSARAVSSAACAAARRPRTQRRPLVHALVLYASTTPRLVKYAGEVATLFSSHGIDVYIQSDVRTSTPPPTTSAAQISESSRSITVDNLDEVVANAAAEFVILITEQNVTHETIQVRVGTQFIERDIDKHISLIIESWAAAITRDALPDEVFSLGMNPNVVTNKHIDFFLQQHPLLRGIRSAYATLARLVDSTQRWLSDTTQDSSFVAIHSNSPNAHVVEQSDQISSHHVGNNSNTKTSTETKSTECELSKSEWEEVAKRALRKGLDAIAMQSQSSTIENSDDVLKGSSTTLRWMKRSTQTRARLLRGHFLVRSLHARLVQTYPIIAAAPVALTPNFGSDQVFSIPSEAHRRRLLREVNFLVMRMEELGSRLSRRPKTRRRRRLSNHLNPWTSYIQRFNAANEKGESVDDDKHSTKFWIPVDENETWRCTACHSLNNRSAQFCRGCSAPSCVLEPGLLPNDNDAMANNIREAIKMSAQQQRPWIFSPSPLPPPSVSPTSGSGRGHNRRGETTPVYSASRIPVPSSDVRIPPITVHNSLRSSTVPSRQLSPDLVDAFRGISIEETSCNGRPGHGRMYDIPIQSPESRNGPMGGLHNYSVPNGSIRPTVNAIPIARSRNGRDRPPPARSPGATDFPGYPHRRMAEEHRPSSFDANMLGNSYSAHSSSRWFRKTPPGDEPHLSAQSSHVLGDGSGNADILLGRSPPLFSSLNGFAGTNGSMFESRSHHKRSDFLNEMPSRINSINGTQSNRTRRQPMDPFSSSVPIMNGTATISSQSVPHMEELAKGSYEAYTSRVSAPTSHPRFPPLEHRSSLEDLAAASDAANGGLGSATTESMRAVMAYRTEFQETDDRRGGGYGLF